MHHAIVIIHRLIDMFAAQAIAVRHNETTNETSWAKASWSFACALTYTIAQANFVSLGPQLNTNELVKFLLCENYKTIMQMFIP